MPIGVCFEPLEPRLLLSGSWGAGVDAPSHDSQTSTHGGFTQETVVVSEITIGSATDIQHQNPRQTAVLVDLLAQASVLNAVNAADPVLEKPSTTDQAAPATGNTSAIGTESDCETQPELMAAAGMRELVFINENIADYQQLIADLQGGDDDRIIEVVVLDADRDGIEQVSEILSERSDLAAVHFIAHGDEGQINLGNTWLNSETLKQNSTAVTGWGDALSETGDILFYGCDIAADSAGQSLLNTISDLTGADVAASDDLTGNPRMGGDWVLEYENGEIDTNVAFGPGAQQHWSGVLATFTVNTTADTVDASPGDGLARDASGNTSLRAAIMEANALAGADEVVLQAGTYLLSLGPSGDDAAARGDLDVTDELILTGAGANTTVIDGADADRVFEILGSTVTISGITIQNGSASDGGGIWLNASSSLTLRDAAVSDNHATNTGGGILVSGLLTLDRATVEGNSADVGGGIFVNNGASATLINTTFSGNSAASNGGAILTRNAVDITNSTIADNTAAAGAGGIHKAGSGNASLKNTILANNTGGNANGALISLGNNIDSQNTAGLDTFLGDQIMTDPMLGGLGDNGGQIKTHALLAGSPAIDTGANAGDPTVDARGFSRIDGRTDIGAYEAETVSLNKIYWVDQFNNKIQRANLDGSNVEDLLTGADGINSPTGLVVDLGGGKIYWSEYTGIGKICRANLDGSGIETLYSGIGYPSGLALDIANNHIYWTENPLFAGINRIRRADMDGGGAISDLVTTGTLDPVDLHLDLEAGKIYWTDGNAGEIRSANLDGSGAGVFASGLTKPMGLRIDPSARMIYWASDGFGTNKIQRANLDGPVVVEDLVTTGLMSPIGLMLDPGAGHIYWSDWGTNKIQRSNLDGSNVTDLVTTGLNLPIGIAMGFAQPNSLPVGVPVINGTVTEDQVLTVDTSGISDADGLGAFSYQWYRGATMIAGAIGSTYTLGDADVGQQISVEVSFTDGMGTPEIVTSAQVGPVVNVNDAPSATNLTTTISYTEGDAVVPITDIVVSDVDAGDIITATLTLANTGTGSLSANDGATYDGGTGVWTITGTVATVNTALANLVFSPNASNDVDTAINVSIDDGDEDGSGALTGMIILDVTPVTNTLTVNTTSDVNDGNTNSIAELIADPGADGFISLREAIMAANATLGNDRLNFEIVGVGPHTITLDPLEGALPFITDAVIIDGTTESDYTNAPVIQIDGSLLSAVPGDNYDGFNLASGSDGSTIRGLSITGFTDGGLHGEAIEVNSSGNTFTSNYIGVAPDGATASGNRTGITLKNGNNRIGGSSAADRNVISDNYYAAVAIHTDAADNNRVIGNYIGVAVDGSTEMANGQGVVVWEQADDNAIGGINPGEGNLIVGGTKGVNIDTTADDTAVLGNSIYGQSVVGIDLDSDGITLNDPNDSDSGPNDLLNYPVLTAATQNGADLDIQFDLDVPAGTYRLEIFENPSGISASGYGGGEVFLGTVTVVSNGTGNQSFSETLFGVTVGDRNTIAATATEDLGSGDYGSTSEFSLVYTQIDQVLAVNTGMTVDEGSTGNTITAAMLATTDVDNTPAQLVYTLSGVPANGTLKLSGVALAVTDSFTQDDIDSGRITYDHGGTENFLDGFDFDVDDGAGTVTSDNFSITITPVNDVPTGSVSISGTPTEDQTLTASNTLADADGMGAVSYQWQRDGVDIAGATGGSYTLSDSDVGAVITVVASYTDGQGTVESVSSVPVGPVANVNDLPAGSVTISGVAAEDQTLTASNTLADADGLGVVSYQWQRAGVDIAGATGSTYTLGDADVGASITVVASYIDGQGTSESVSSAGVGPIANVNDNPVGLPVITGTVAEDQVLTADTAGLSDADGLGVFNYQWLRNGSLIGGATAASYTLDDADVGQQISVEVSYTDGQGTVETVTSAPVGPVANVNDLPAGSVTISGVATEDQTLTASNTLADADGLGVVSYQWQRDGVDIAGATGSSYTLGDLDVGTTITVVARYTDGHGTIESVPSAGVGPVSNVNDAPTGSVSIGGTPAEDQTLTATNTLADADGMGPVSYQWRRNGVDIGGATGATYTLGDLDVGAVITVAASYTDAQGTPETVISAGVGPVANVNDPGTVSIDNLTPTVGDMLMASVNDVDGAGGPIAYQWYRDGVAIAGATGVNYTAVLADEGKVITVTADYTDDRGTVASLTSVGTAPVAHLNVAPTASNLNAAESYVEDTPLDLTDIEVTDVDSANVTVTLTLSDPAAGSLSTGTSGSVTASFSGGVWSAAGPIADVNALLAGVVFTPFANHDGSFSITAGVSDGVAGPITGIKVITGTPVGDTPQTSGTATPMSVQSGLIVIERNADDGAEVTHFRISNISNGRLYFADGITPINDGDYITVAQGQAGVRFTPDAGSLTPGSFSVEASEDGMSVAGQSGAATSVITVFSLPEAVTTEPPTDSSDPVGPAPETDPEAAEPAAETEATTEEDVPLAVASPVSRGPVEELVARHQGSTNAPMPFLVQAVHYVSQMRAAGVNFRDIAERLSDNVGPSQKAAAADPGPHRADLQADVHNLISARAYLNMVNSLDAVKKEMAGDNQLNRVYLGSAIVSSIGLSVGYVVWLIRGGLLLSSLLSSLPAWQILDPLPILARKKDDDNSEDDESLESILDRKPRKPNPKNEPADASSAAKVKKR